jgi:hypothetical protein
MSTFRKINNLTGWAVGAIAFTVYASTVEPTASFWDCGEFIASSYKLMIQHPPGAPFFLLIGRLFSFLALGDTTLIAFWINILSALCSAFTIVFLFWTITLLGRKLLNLTHDEPSRPQILGLLAAGAIGALAYTFSDSFWFSAVEAEVYAMSSLFTAVVVWAMLRWERLENESVANRWLILIAYIIGLSIGTHLLNLVTIPALAFIYYFKKYTPNFRGGLLTLAIGMVLIFALMIGLRTGLPAIASKFDIFFVNQLGLPFGSGVAIFSLLSIGGLVYGIYYSIQKNKATLNTALLGLAFILVGYCSYSIILIRAQYNPPINLNNPDDAASFTSYLNMEQYGSGRPLLYGPHFTAEIIDQQNGAPRYVKGKYKYEVHDYQLKNTYDPRHMTLLPRLYSKDRTHVELYKQMLELREGKKPTMADNLKFLFSYQLGHMYGRYFMWNFAGKTSDKEGSGWMASLTPDKSLPSEISRNKGHNTFFMLPLLLGVLGLIYQFGKHRQGFLIVSLLFFLTGIALVLYLNSPPTEPRERDYIYVGSFYAFAIWIGIGVLALCEYINKLVKQQMLGPVLAGALCASVPILLATQNWDDHDRSGRYFAVDSAKNLLNSCAPNAILFTNGDNDTYPLWYAQEVEGVRRDVRVCVMQFMGTDWYIDQLKRKTYQSEALPVSLEQKNYISAENNQILYLENANVQQGINLKEYIKLIKEDHPALKVDLQNGESMNVLPSNKLVLPVNKQDVLQKNFVPTEFEDLLTDSMVIELNKEYLLKDDLIFLDILATNNWERPIYFSSLFSASKYNLQSYTQIEGMVCRLLPVKVPGASQGFINTNIMYENMMKKNDWRGLNDPKVYHDEVHRKYISNWGRLSFLQLGTQFINEGNTQKAKEVLLHSLRIIPDESIPYDRLCSLYVAPLLAVGEEKRALDIAQTMAKRADENLSYYIRNKRDNEADIQDNLIILNQLALAMKEENHAQAPKYQALFDKYYNKL